jgi:hypothetical protein
MSSTILATQIATYIELNANKAEIALCQDGLGDAANNIEGLMNSRPRADSGVTSYIQAIRPTTKNLKS